MDSASPEAGKLCHTCQRFLPHTSFNKSKRTHDGLQSQCRDCQRRYREDNHEAILAGKKRYYLKDPKRWNEYTRAYYHSNRERLLADMRDRQARYREAPDYQQRIFDRNLAARYKMTIEQKAAMLEAQHHVCAICGCGLTMRSAAVDHSHTTGKVRGLLCLRCNTGVGMLRDSTKVLKAAIRYLREAEADGAGCITQLSLHFTT